MKYGFFLTLPVSFHSLFSCHGFTTLPVCGIAIWWHCWGAWEKMGKDIVPEYGRNGWQEKMEEELSLVVQLATMVMQCWGQRSDSCAECSSTDCLLGIEQRAPSSSPLTEWCHFRGVKWPSNEDKIALERKYFITTNQWYGFFTCKMWILMWKSTLQPSEDPEYWRVN